MNNHHRKTCSLSLLNQMQIRVPRTLSFASPNGKGEAESCNRLEAISGDKASTECAWSLDFPESKVESSSHLDSEAYLSGGSITDQNVATVLDKLNALRSHLLASEKWNASRLHSCDRFVEIYNITSNIASISGSLCITYSLALLITNS